MPALAEQGLPAGTARTAPWVVVALGSLAFAFAYSQYPLFYHTQNQYFFYGLVRSGFGFLKNDWFARTADPWPVFTRMVEWTYRYLDPGVFYISFIVLAGVYAFSMLGIVSRLFANDRSTSRVLAFLAIITALHSPVFGYASRIVLGLPLTESSPHHFNVGRILLLEGVGEKRILGDMLNPATFGALLLLSVYLFLRNRPFLAVTAAVVAAFFHPSYILNAGILTLSYMLILVRKGEGLGRPLGVGAYAFVLILPLLIYAGTTFRQTDPSIWKQSQDILVRIAYYPPSVPALWLGATAYLKVGLMLWALYVIRRTDLFLIMLLSFVATTGLTILQMLTGSTTLALLLPWRVSAFLVPLSTVILVGYGLSALLDRPGPKPISTRALSAASVVVLILLVGAGAVETKWRFDAAADANWPGVMRFVRANKAPGQTYLIPPTWRSFRLFTGAPVFAERSVIPYTDVDVMEWYKRVRLADAFYGTREEDTEYRSQRERRNQGGSIETMLPRTVVEPPREERCRMLKELATGYGVSGVILERGDLEGCPGWKLVFRDGTNRLYAAAP